MKKSPNSASTRLVNRASIFLVALSLYAGAAIADLENENLLQPLPSHFKIANQDGNRKMSLTEMVPSDETVDTWSTMVTTQIYHGATNASFDVYRSGMERRWQEACDTAEAASVSEGEENGYPFQIWLQSCHFTDDKRPPGDHVVQDDQRP